MKENLKYKRENLKYERSYEFSFKIIFLGALILFFSSFVSAQQQRSEKKDSFKLDGCTVIFDPPSLERFIGTLEKRLNEIKSREKDLVLKMKYLQNLQNLSSSKRISKPLKICVQIK
jgi:hypothetical protein